MSARICEQVDRGTFTAQFKVRRTAMLSTRIGLMVLCLLGCATGAAQPERRSPADPIPPTCENWLKLSDDQHVVVIGSAFQGKVGNQNSSKFAGCVWSRGDAVIADVNTGCAVTAARYDEVVGRAFDQAIASCRRP
jgi:hypothetical protein